jgi:hypothetical protein
MLCISICEDFKPVLARAQSLSLLIFQKNPLDNEPFLVREFLRLTTAILTLGKLENVLVGGKIILDAVFTYKVSYA